MFDKHVYLRQIRFGKGYSNAGAARGAKTNKSSLSKFEKGKMKRDRLLVLDLMEFYQLPEYIRNILKKESPSEAEVNILRRYISKL